MIFHIILKNKNIIKICQNKYVKVFLYCYINESLKFCKSVYQSKWYNLVLEMTISVSKSRLSFITVTDLNEIVFPMNVNI